MGDPITLDSVIGEPPEDRARAQPALGLHQVRWVRTVLATAAIVGIAMFTFMVASSIKQVPVNTGTIERNCMARNRQLARVNAKFAQLDLLFDASIAERQAQGRPVPPDILALYTEYKKPINLEPCEALGR